MANKINASTLSYEPFKDGTLALYTTDSLMIVPQSRYQELLHMEELHNAMHKDLDNKQNGLERERKMLKKTKYTANRRSTKVKAAKHSLAEKGN